MLQSYIVDSAAMGAKDKTQKGAAKFRLWSFASNWIIDFGPNGRHPVDTCAFVIPPERG